MIFSIALKVHRAALSGAGRFQTVITPGLRGLGKDVNVRSKPTRGACLNLVSL
jgi:hypothetical protein